MVDILSIYKKMFMRKLRKLIVSCEESGLAIIVRDDPSADSLTSALALKHIAEHFHVEGEIFYRGEIQNRMLLNLMEDHLNVLQSPADVNGYELAFVNAIPSQLKHMTRPPSIIITHYEGDIKDIKVELKDIRSDVGTTSSIMAEYLKQLKIPIDEQLATQILYALREETREFLTNMHKFDFDMYYRIFPSADIDLLMELEHPSVKSETFGDLAKSIENKMVKDTHLITSIGYTKDVSTLPKVCDYLLDLEGISTALIFSIGRAEIQIYAKSKDIKTHMRNVLERAFGVWGVVSGTPVHASIEMPLGVFETVLKGDKDTTKSKELLFESIKNVISSRYLSTVETEG